MDDTDIINGIIDAEGGYVDHPDDRGGATKYGITQRTLSNFLGRPASMSDVSNLSRDVAYQIYLQQYVMPFRWITSARLRYFVINSAVQHGVPRAIRLLQMAANTVADGEIGPITRAKVEAEPINTLLNMISHRAQFYAEILQRDKSQRVFAAGWLHRIAKDLGHV